MIHNDPADFEKIYASGGWDGLGAGPGSTEEFTRGFRSVLEALIREKKIKSVFDLGCGDWQWQRHVDWQCVTQYTGWDVSKTATDKCPWEFSSAEPTSCKFACCDAFLEPLWPEADLLIVKDVVHHISPYRVRMLVEKARLHSWVLWVVDMKEMPPIIEGRSELFPCNWPYSASIGDPIYTFDTSPPYPYGPKAAFLQQNP